jgi:hypothetical protein
MDTENRWHGGAVQWPHRRCVQDPQAQQPRGHAAVRAALCGAVEPPVAAVSAQKEHIDGGHESLASDPSAPVSEAAARPGCDATQSALKSAQAIDLIRVSSA